MAQSARARAATRRCAPPSSRRRRAPRRPVARTRSRALPSATRALPSEKRSFRSGPGPRSTTYLRLLAFSQRDATTPKPPTAAAAAPRPSASRASRGKRSRRRRPERTAGGAIGTGSEAWLAEKPFRTIDPSRKWDCSPSVGGGERRLIFPISPARSGPARPGPARSRRTPRGRDRGSSDDSRAWPGDPAGGAPSTPTRPGTR